MIIIVLLSVRERLVNSGNGFMRRRKWKQILFGKRMPPIVSDELCSHRSISEKRVKLLIIMMDNKRYNTQLVGKRQYHDNTKRNFVFN